MTVSIGPGWTVDNGWTLGSGSSGVGAWNFNGANDLIILDLVMPETDGFEVLERLKEKGINNVPIIVLSNLGQGEDVERAMSLGAFKYIIKSNVSIHSGVTSISIGVTVG